MNTPRRVGPPLGGLLSMLLAPAAWAQAGGGAMGGVKATVRDAFGTPIIGAQVFLVGSPMRGETDDHGQFSVAKTAAGAVTLQVRRIGFRPDTSIVSVPPGKYVPVEIVLNRFALELLPVVVQGRKQLTGQLAGFYARRARGVGHFFTREDLEKQNQANMVDVLRMTPGVRVVGQGMSNRGVRFRDARCPPLTWLDGFPLYAGEYDLDAVDPRTFAGVEVYNGSASVPIEFQGNQIVGNSSCGTIVLWTRQGELRVKQRKNGEPSAAAQIAQLVEQNSVFTASQVDVPARIEEGNPVHPMYPDSLFDRGIPGKVLTEFVVNASGEVMMDTFSIVMTSHEAFSDAVRRAIRLQRYTPAQRNGKVVQQVVQQPFEFVPDSTAIRKR
ncbi:MAG TPA: carboxypeptidase regulatory-like domain-containing protein [Gemmatimonadaceae bacterium]|nr:carboxypeptidase regulatory-like domain-containing protein [Gemmatimonadaceae bacterium]